MAAVTGTMTAAGVSTSVAIGGSFSAAVWRTTSGSRTSLVSLERSFDEGTTWVSVYLPAFNGTAFGADASMILQEPENGTLYRIRAANVATGETINYRIGQ